MARPRSGLNSRLPVNLSLHYTGLYRYVRPDTKKHCYLSRNRQESINAANQLNALLIPSNDLVEKVIQTDHPLSDCVRLFQDEDAPNRNWKPSTAKLYFGELRRIESDLGQRYVERLTTRDLAEYLRETTESPRRRQQLRNVLVWVFDMAVQEGWINANPAKQTKAPKSKRKRARLTLRDYQQLHALADPWLQNAMDLSLHTLQRAGDVCEMRFEDIREGCLFVVPRKTETSTFVRMKLRIGIELGPIIERCRDGIASPYLVHNLPRRMPPRQGWAEGREHYTQVLRETLTRAMSALVRKSGLYKGVESPPTFHEIRSLGGALYREKGWSLQQVHELMGHASESMTMHYMEGHDAPWVEVNAGLNLAGNGNQMVNKW